MYLYNYIFIEIRDQLAIHFRGMLDIETMMGKIRQFTLSKQLFFVFMHLHQTFILTDFNCMSFAITIFFRHWNISKCGCLNGQFLDRFTLGTLS